MTRSLFLIAVVVLVSGCSGSTAPQTAPPPEPEVTAAEVTLPRSVHWMRNSAEYHAALQQTYALAAAELRRMVDGRQEGSWAVALDADETVISNSLYEKELTQAGKRSDSASWRAWVERREAAPLPGAVEFVRLVGELGGRVAIVTNRSIRDCPDTMANFERYDIPFDVMLCKGEDGEKEPRWRMVADGSASEELPPLEIVMWIGDNIQDFPDLDQSLRFADSERFEEFGRRYFIVPNPMYGSWQPNPHD